MQCDNSLVLIVVGQRIYENATSLPCHGTSFAGRRFELRLKQASGPMETPIRGHVRLFELFRKHRLLPRVPHDLRPVSAVSRGLRRDVRSGGDYTQMTVSGGQRLKFQLYGTFDDDVNGCDSKGAMKVVGT